MVEFLYNSSIFEQKNQKIFINGHSFTQGDLRVRIGALTVNYPKFLLVQVSYPPSVYLREENRDTEMWKQSQIDELLRYCLHIEQAEVNLKRLKNSGSIWQLKSAVGQNAQNAAPTFEEKQCM